MTKTRLESLGEEEEGGEATSPSLSKLIAWFCLTRRQTNSKRTWIIKLENMPLNPKEMRLSPMNKEPLPTKRTLMSSIFKNLHQVTTREEWALRSQSRRRRTMHQHSQELYKEHLYWWQTNSLSSQSRKEWRDPKTTQRMLRITTEIIHPKPQQGNKWTISKEGSLAIDHSLKLKIKIS